MAASENEFPNLQTDEWTRLFGDSTYEYPLDEFDRQEASNAMDESFKAKSDHHCNEVSCAIENADLPMPLPSTLFPESIPNDEVTPAAAPPPAVTPSFIEMPNPQHLVLLLWQINVHGERCCQQGSKHSSRCLLKGR